MGFGYEIQKVKAVISDVTASRAIDGTIYRNTSGRPILAIISLTCIRTTDAERAFVTGYVENVTPPTVVNGAAGLHVAAGITESAEVMLGFLLLAIPNNDYYRIRSTVDGSATVTLFSWVEVEL